MSLLEQSFELRGPGALVFGRGRIDEVGDRASRFGERALVVTDAGIRKAGLLDPVQDALERGGLTVDVYDGVEADPTVANADDAAGAADDADIVIGLGGGSSIDVAKTAALAAGRGPVDDLLDAETPPGDGKPTVLLPTTAGTGSEVSPAAVLQGADGKKQGLIDDALFADLALVDPDFTMDLPAPLTATTGIDAFAHAVGSFISTDTNELADGLCRRAMELVEGNLRAATFRGADSPEARVGMSMAATMAMLGRVNGGKAAIHSVAYGIQAMYDVPHAKAIAMVMPAVLEYNRPAAQPAMAALGTALYDAQGPTSDRATAFVDGVRQLRDDLDLDVSLRDVGATAADLDRLAELAVHSKRHLDANPRAMTATDARAILEPLL